MSSQKLGAGVEFDLIRRFLHDAAAEGDDASPDARVLVGPGDDCAVVRAGPLAISVDLSVEDVHFRRAWLEPEEIGYRATAAALSDLAAVAAEPVGVLVSLAIAPAEHATLGPAILRGVRAAAHAVGARVIGGDVTRARDALTLDIVVVGHVERPVLRSGARPGDEVWVTGRLGAAAAAVAAWQAGRSPVPDARAAFAHPVPRTREAIWLHERAVLHAMIDVSDGVAGDADHLAAASDVNIEIDAAHVPVHPAARETGDTDEGAVLAFVLHGGDDYELLFTVAPGTVGALAASFEAEFDTPLTCIGSVQDGTGVRLRQPDGTLQPLARGGYDHFAEEPA